VGNGFDLAIAVFAMIISPHRRRKVAGVGPVHSGRLSGDVFD